MIEPLRSGSNYQINKFTEVRVSFEGSPNTRPPDYLHSSSLVRFPWLLSDLVPNNLMSLFIWNIYWRGLETLYVMIKRKNMNVMEGMRLISCLDNSTITSWLQSTANKIAAVSSTAEKQKLSLPRIHTQYKLSKMCLRWLDRRKRFFSLKTLGTTKCWSPHPYELEASSWTSRMTPVPCVK